ncbi:MAG TPA: hypothetical protein VLS89_12050 [Candidatus Nanopelagicales bacterium]|nr:hypothetical protein [Candidatus Nanopelagicales bacterium]
MKTETRDALMATISEMVSEMAHMRDIIEGGCHPEEAKKYRNRISDVLDHIESMRRTLMHSEDER